MAKAVAEQAPPREFVFAWTGKNRQGHPVHGHMRAANALQAQTALRKQGIFVTRLTKRSDRLAKSIKPKEIALFTRQMATMLKAGVPLLQTFDIVGKSTPNPQLSKLLQHIRQDIETGTSLSLAFRKHPRYFDGLYCNVIQAGETAGILDPLLDRLANAMEKTESIKRKIKSVLMYPLSVTVVAWTVVAVIMVWVIPAFQDVFGSLGADLPLITQLVLTMSAGIVQYGWWLAGVVISSVFLALYAFKRSPRMQSTMDRLVLAVPILGSLIDKSCAARWARTLSTVFAAGLPLVEALECVGGVAGNSVYRQATQYIQHEVSTGSSLTTAMESTRIFPTMMVQMCAIGEESGTLDHMLAKVADFYEQAFDETVVGLSSLLEPFIIIFLGSIIGGIVVAVYLPVFKLGQIV